MAGLPRIEISVSEQRLALRDGARVLATWPVSTAANGTGCRRDTGCTPLGRHRVRVKVGEGLPAGAVLAGRRWTGEVLDARLAAQHPGRDWIVTRLLWLDGLEPGINRRGDVDTLRRFIYIHGTHDEARIGQPVSHGCIRMRSGDVLDLFARVRPGTEVLIAD